MVVKIFLVDVLVDGLFSGGRAAVVILRHLGQEVFLQALAAELGLPVTAYVLPYNEAFMVRYFSPRRELETADYAALATAQALFGAGLAPVTRPVSLLGRGGRHQVARDAQEPGRLVLSLGPPLSGLADPAPAGEQLAADLGLAPEELAGLLSVGENELALCCRESGALHRVAPGGAAALLARSCAGLILSAPLEDGTGYVVRCWDAAGETVEAPLNLGPQAILAPFWAERLGRRQLTVHHLAERTCLFRADLDQDSRTSISGLLSTILKADPLLSELTGEQPPPEWGN